MQLKGRYALLVPVRAVCTVRIGLNFVKFNVLLYLHSVRKCKQTCLSVKYLTISTLTFIGRPTSTPNRWRIRGGWSIHCLYIYGLNSNSSFNLAEKKTESHYTLDTSSEQSTLKTLGWLIENIRYKPARCAACPLSTMSKHWRKLKQVTTLSMSAQQVISCAQANLHQKRPWDPPWCYARPHITSSNDWFPFVSGCESMKHPLYLSAFPRHTHCGLYLNSTYTQIMNSPLQLLIV